MPSPGDAHPLLSAATSSGEGLRKRVSNGQLNASNRYSIPPPPVSPSPPPTPQTPTKKPRKRRSVQSLKVSETATTTAVAVGPNANSTFSTNDMSTLAADGIVHSAHRTPHSARFPRPPGDDEEEVLIGLLSGSTVQTGDGRVSGMDALEEESEDGMEGKKSTGPMSSRDKYAIALLIVLCESLLWSLAWHTQAHLRPDNTVRSLRVQTDLIQGIPIGLAFGSIPFLLKSKLSYSQLGTFSLAT